ncbi:MAG: YuzF family protein [Acidimicrobiia bacterium]|nr:YuzF family protein [Acidimicrobiia bacterium]
MSELKPPHIDGFRVFDDESAPYLVNLADEWLEAMAATGTRVTSAQVAVLYRICHKTSRLHGRWWGSVKDKLADPIGYNYGAFLRVLGQLVELGVLKKHGRARNVVYQLFPDHYQTQRADSAPAIRSQRVSAAPRARAQPAQSATNKREEESIQIEVKATDLSTTPPTSFEEIARAKAEARTRAQLAAGNSIQHPKAYAEAIARRDHELRHEVRKEISATPPAEFSSLLEGIAAPMDEDEALTLDELVRQLADNQCHVCSNTRHESDELLLFRGFRIHVRCAPQGWTADRWAPTE